MSIQELLEEGDTGEAILPDKVNGRGACPNDEHQLGTCHVCNGSGIVDDFDGWSLCSRCDGRGHFHDKKAPRPDTPSMDDARDRGAEKSVARHRLRLLSDMTDDERRNMLAWISGFAPDVFDRAAQR